jgi:hypothetical protein
MSATGAQSTLSGTPTGDGAYTFTITVTDAEGTTVAKTFQLTVSSSAVQGSVVTFENLADQYYFFANVANAGQNIGNYEPGFTVGPNVTALSVSRFGGYNSTAYPPHSGDVALWDVADPTITITFSSAVKGFGVWYVSLGPIVLQAFDQDHNPLGAVTGIANTDGMNGVASLLSFSGTGIKSIQITGTPGLFVLSSFTTSTQQAPADVPLLRFSKTQQNRLILPASEGLKSGKLKLSDSTAWMQSRIPPLSLFVNNPVPSLQPYVSIGSKDRSEYRFASFRIDRFRGE